MRKFLYLWDHEFKHIGNDTLRIAMLSSVMQLFFLHRNQVDPRNFMPFEQMFAESGAIIIAMFSFVAMCGLCVMSFNYNFNQSKSIYTLMTLPQSRVHMIFSKIAAWFTGFVVLILNQILIGIIGFKLFEPILQRRTYNGIVPTGMVEEPITNGLFLFFTRSHFYRILMPLTLEGIVSSLAIITSIIFAIYYVLICQKSYGYKGMFILIVQLTIIIYVLRYRTQFPDYYFDATYHNLYISSIILLGITGFYIRQIIYLIKKSTIT
ncbi:hypothetical protein EDC19_0076 [Natranaerovirga hydrolytica]|uniref:ABC-2 family transporter n=1 Tax=Natranaerovirga hydrolytica TaxID=680378 RepID=A0A4R1N0W2_9FIRM|nr:hypothetical protein [Natranaerovirga hydrolytica]TCK99718.1 hypothetical protein EDC19_0076 [Natranaerovirga hydrolytica]